MTQSNIIGTTQTNHLKIATTITETKSVEKEITLPYYFKNAYGNFCKIVTPTHYLTVRSSSHSPLICSNLVEFGKSEIAEGTPCTQEEYDAAFGQAMMYLQALNSDEPIDKSEDENVKIDEMLYGRAI